MRLAPPVAALALLAACGGGGATNDTTPVVPPKGPGEACTATAQCRTDLACLAGFCNALAAAAWCPSPGTTPAAPVAGVMFDPGDPGPSACVSTVRAARFGTAGDLDVQDLGTFDVNAPVTFAVRAGTTSFSIVSQEVDGSAVDMIVYQGTTLPNTVVPDQVKTPTGTVYYDDNSARDPTVDPAVYWGFSPGAGTFTAPNTTAGLDALRSAGALPPGTWSFLANDWANECATGRTACTASRNTGRYRLHAITKTAPLASTGALDVQVYLLTDPANAISTAAAAAADPRVGRWVASLGTFLGKGGVCLGTVTFHDLPAWVHRRYPNGTVDITGEGPCDPLQQLLAASSAPARGPSLFLVEELIDRTQSPSGTVTVGIDGTIPGPSGFPGTIASGAAVGLFGELGAGFCSGTGAPSLSGCGTDRLAYVAAHELGHWLGLYHTTESDGTLFDPLSDTAECPSSCAPRGSPGSGGMTVSSCKRGTSCGGGDNLMFWLLDPVYSVGNLSRDQGQVVRLNPAVR